MNAFFRLTHALGVGSLFFLLSAAQSPPSENQQAHERFCRATALSFMSGRSGDLFFFPRKYSFVTFDSGDYSHDGFSHVLEKGQESHVKHGGSSHGSVWDYDIDIPLALYGPGFIQAGKKIARPATQQDIVPTLAQLIGAVPPEDARHGSVLKEALKPTSRKPKAILTLVFDQGGWAYYRAHPQAHPFLDSLMAAGTLYTQAQVTHLDSETSVGHIAIGTGAYPYQHGIVSNSFFLASLGKRSSLLGPDRSPIFINSPSLADVWDLQTANRAIIFSYAYADRAAIGMAGHGAMYAGGDKDLVIYYDSKTGLPTTHSRYYQVPDYLKDHQIKPYLDAVVNAQGLWHEHQVNNLEDVNKTPAQARYDADLFLKMLAHEPVGEDQITDLLFLTLKSSDACGHAFGMETVECGEVLAEQDRQARRIVEALEKKLGKDNFVVVLSADHGGAPLAELSGGHRISANPLKAALNKALDTLDNGVPLVQDLTASQIYLEENELRRNGKSFEDVRQFLLNYRVGGEPVFREVLTREEVVREQLKMGLY
ncbi:hypothetical protein COW36_12655 [bacterium (Candidatus Blackallbacteria) CG17_big_fil_post_rev_8_21_14_2_50_48_46]|uniref:Alkaline phosphatase family protein n=1 Tax=bacterium (Candidatus Blackallbacteria) CG17_big_fil_post_rev_8_21_14_2_50_48_46 TaxID=2014261 RepID=A0A2M7G4E2_9BACT|nr:MAG: hypothetical protein COW64_02605 [bacterium (Candidatus Blackallbacteria) CG18_big_fil_WC_8_21_14_2_50_49_26]PIW16611.1 MAG: hypothetical protein COW36_12655 [bacterium (Candidatus Blackallbacteria) CG17_big_fil_post_rev_8_21_14_2_50_48_46]PIW46119.1 MAG: hypothetical protein COW20_17920 [bacterium (Candidatus Blackallbacteria) CG13_big_fil_rev_8_21_14_2_50_49_14]